MTNRLEDARRRSAVIAERVRQRTDLELRGIIESFDEELTFAPFALPGGYSMRYGSEPDIQFQLTANDETSLVATIEIKGGKDAAGALERLRAVQKSFEETPPNCVNMLIAGIITPEMALRLDTMGVGRRYLLDDLVRDGEPWVGFLNEVFHHTVRITPSVIESAE